MEWLLFLAVSGVAAVLLMFVQGQVATANPATQTSYFGKVAVLAVGIFVTLIAAAWLVGLVDGKARIPAV